jgi:hypothetical protein
MVARVRRALGLCRDSATPHLMRKISRQGAKAQRRQEKKQYNKCLAPSSPVLPVLLQFAILL